ncbi:MAG: nucleotide exchange factor GrpE [Pseudomonadota bacterium]
MGNARKEADEPFLDDIELAAEEESEAPDAPSGLAEEAAEYSTEDEIQTVIDKLVSERDDMRDRWMRAMAEAENARKRADRDRREAEQYGGSKISRDMLPVFDNLQRALEAATDEQREANKALFEGVELTLRELLNVFGKHGIEKIEPQVGDRFDPQMHQAMFEAPVPGTRAGDIIQVAAYGFRLHERLLRPAQVGVSSTPATKDDKKS